MDFGALKISLNSLIESGDVLDDNLEDVRKYIDLYCKIKEYIGNAKGKNAFLLEAYSELPEIKFVEFKNPYYLLKEFIYKNFTPRYRMIGGSTLSDLFPDETPYPAKTMYLNDLMSKVLKINAIAKMLIMEIDGNLERNSA